LQCLLRQLLFLLHAAGVDLPAFQLGLNRFNGRQLLNGTRLAVSEQLPVEFVACADFDCVEFVQDVQLSQVDGGDAADHLTLLQLHEVQPAAAPLAAGGHALLPTLSLKVHT